MPAHPDRRRAIHPRFPFRIPATVRSVAAPESAPLGLTENLSGGGIGMRVFGSLDPGTEVTVILHLLNRPSLLWTGRIVWVKCLSATEWRVGIAFDNALAPAVVNQLVTEGAWLFVGLGRRA